MIAEVATTTMTSLCVWNICTDEKLLSVFCDSTSNHTQGVQSTVETAPNEAIHLCWKQSLINSVYLQNLFVWQGAKPRTPTTSSCLHGRRNLNVFWMLFYS